PRMAVRAGRAPVQATDGRALLAPGRALALRHPHRAPGPRRRHHAARGHAGLDLPPGLQPQPRFLRLHPVRLQPRRGPRPELTPMTMTTADPAARGKLAYSDGTRTRYADPARVHRRLTHALDGDPARFVRDSRAVIPGTE